MVLGSAPAAGLAFLALAVAVAIARVVGRYHYIVDTFSGLGVGLASWWWLG
jgi:membrane-associated phospholipid phosphatase